MKDAIATIRLFQRLRLSIWKQVLWAACFPVSTICVGRKSSHISAVAWILVDGEYGKTLVEHNANLQLQPASLTKFLTAYIVFEELHRKALHWDDRVVACAIKAFRDEEATMHLDADHENKSNTLSDRSDASSARSSTPTNPTKSKEIFLRSRSMEYYNALEKA